MEWKITIWDDPRIAYIATAKVANTAVKAALLKSYVEERHWSNPHGEGMPYVEATPGELRDKYSDYLTFAVARNPYDRFVSFYADKIVGEGWYRALGRHGFKKGMSFEECALVAAKNPDGQTDPHATSQIDRLEDSDGTFLPDLVLRFEEITHDWKALRAIVEARSPEQPLAPLAARRTSKRETTWQSYYTPRAQEAVAERYARDFEVLGYSTELEPSTTAPRRSAEEDLVTLRAALSEGTLVLDATGHDDERQRVVTDAGGWYLPFGPGAELTSRGVEAARLARKLADGPRAVVVTEAGSDDASFGPARDTLTVIEAAPSRRGFIARLLRR